MAADTPVVSASELTRVFGEFVAVDRVSFEVGRGEIFGFLGSNGAGKTTTIRMLIGVLAPSDGRATVAGLDVATQGAEIKQKIGYMSQRFSLYGDLTVEENLRFWGSAYGMAGGRLADRLRWAVEAAGLEERRRALVRDLPGGYRQRLALGAALLHSPPVLFLDEPTGGVDPEARRRFWDLIDDLAVAGHTIFVTTHYMDEAERCHRVALMHAGRLLALDSPTALKGMFDDGSVVEITCRSPAGALEVLLERPEVVDAALFGSRLHATLVRPGHSEQLAAALSEAGHGPVEIVPIVPSLEDVFIHVIRQAEAGEAA